MSLDGNLLYHDFRLHSRNRIIDDKDNINENAELLLRKIYYTLVYIIIFVVKTALY